MTAADNPPLLARIFGRWGYNMTNKLLTFRGNRWILCDSGKWERTPIPRGK